MISLPEIKKNVGLAAVSLIKEGMIVGLGSGTTASCFIESLIERCQRRGLKISTVCSSIASSQMAKKGGLTVIDDDQFTKVDLYIDGADEIDPHLSLIKGGGGNLVREKIVATASKEMVVIADSNKLHSKLGSSALAVELIPFGCLATIQKLKELNFTGTLRRNKDQSIFVTDNQNYIIDLNVKESSHSPKDIHKVICGIPGVVETGFFFNMAKRFIIGYENGDVIMSANPYQK